ncbi:MAG: hypothetical protein QOH36_47 [Actinomycetota bacterium]|nr:hypothetical protein [Actinomycetota bacterium]
MFLTLAMVRARPASEVSLGATVLQVSTVFHIGLMKTGSTALQLGVFPTLPGCALATHGTHELFKPLCWSLLHSTDANYYAATLRQFLRDVQGDQPTVLFSQEAISWYHLEGRTARRLHDVDPDAQVVVVVRSQRTILRSIYHQYLQHGGTRTVAQWLESPDYDPSQLAYDDIVAPYLDLFGSDRVRVLLYEDLVADPSSFVAEFCAFAGIAVPAPAGPPTAANRSLARPSFWGLRRLNELTRMAGIGSHSPLFPNLWPEGMQRPSRHRGSAVTLLTRADAKLFGPGLRRPGSADQAAIERVAAGFRESNARLEKLAGVFLRPHGYPLPD